MENFNRLNDLYFKKLLGDKKRKNLTLSFLNGILNKNDENCFTDITFLDKDNEPLSLEGKLSKLDIRADLNDGTQVDIEVQVCPFKLMAERSLYYWSKMYSEQLEKGAEYKKLKKAIAINLLAFDYLEDEQDWHNIYNLLNVKSHKKLTSFSVSCPKLATLSHHASPYISQAPHLRKEKPPPQFCKHTPHSGSYSAKTSDDVLDRWYHQIGLSRFLLLPYGKSPRIPPR